MTSTAFKQIGNLNSAIGALLDNVIETVKTDVTTALRQEYQQKLNETTNQLNAEITTALRQEYQQKLTETTNQLNVKIVDLQTKYEHLKEPRWPSGSYCILANGACPAGFNRISGHMAAIKQYAATSPYIKAATFGDSKIKCHGSCGQYGQWVGELYLVTCCK